MNHQSIPQYVRAKKGTRTLDLLITNQLRYRLRYLGLTSTMDIIAAKLPFGKQFFQKVQKF